MPEEPSEQKTALASAEGGRFFVVGRGMFGMLEILVHFSSFTMST